MARQIQLAMVAVAVAALVGCSSRRAPAPAVPPAVVPPAHAAQLVTALRQGGLVLFLRHAATDRSRDDDARLVLENCATQRNLSAAGRAQAQAIAVALQRLHVPIGVVRASPYCRCAETARLAFGHLLLDNDLLPTSAANAKRRLAAVRLLLGTPPIPGRNSALVGHGDTIAALFGLELAEGETLVVRPAPGGGSFTLVGRIRADQWSALVSGALVRR